MEPTAPTTPLSGARDRVPHGHCDAIEQERAAEYELAGLGVWLYRLQQRDGATAISAVEWRRV